MTKPAELASSPTFAKEAEATAHAEQRIQAGIDKTDKAAGKKKEPKPMQAGARRYPVPPLLSNI